MTKAASRTQRATQVKDSTVSLPMPRVLWDARTTPEIVTVPARTVLALDGQGAPEGVTFQNSVGAVYGVAYTLEFARKKAGRGEFKIGPLEARWWTDEPARHFMDTPRNAWRWQLRMAIPSDVGAAELARTIEDGTHKKGGKLEGNPEAARLALAPLPAASFGRLLHIGPYATEGESFARIAKAVDDAGMVARDAHLEVYLSDPRLPSRRS